MTENDEPQEFKAEECADIREFLFKMMEKRIKCVDRSDGSTIVEVKDDGIKLLASSSGAVGDEHQLAKESETRNGEPKRKKSRKIRKVDSGSDSSDNEEKRHRKFESISVDVGFVTQFK